MVLIKIFVAIILTKLQRFESSASKKELLRPACPEIYSLKRTPEARTVETDLISVVNVKEPSNHVRFSRIHKLLSRSLSLDLCGIVRFLITFTLLSKCCNFVKMFVTKIFMKTILVENFMQNIFCNLTFFSKVHISRENRENLLRVQVLTPFTKEDRAEDQEFFGNA